jgi:long-chain acyl-CoA synthetase
VFQGYWRKPEATGEALEPDGRGGRWFRTGDIGVLEDGFLRITDRKKDIIVTAGGKNVAPQNLENALKASCPLVSQVMVHGDRRPYLTALVTLGEEGVRAFSAAEVRAEVERAIKALNAAQPPYATIKKFAILPSDFSQETGELTPTLKVKRRFTTEKFQAVLDGLYAN